MITICTNQPMSANLSRENSNIMANLHLSLNALDDICSQLELSWEVSANRQTSSSVLFQHICIHRSANAFTRNYSWQNLIKYFRLKTSISKCSVKKFQFAKIDFRQGGKQLPESDGCQFLFGFAPLPVPAHIPKTEFSLFSFPDPKTSSLEQVEANHSSLQIKIFKFYKYILYLDFIILIISLILMNI